MPIETLEKPLAYECEASPRSLVEHWWQHQLTDLAGKPTGPLHLVKGNSWVANMASQMVTRLSSTNRTSTNTAGGTVTMTVGSTPTHAWGAQAAALPSGAGSDFQGVIPGTQVGPPAEDTTDFDVAGRVIDGVGAGQLLYQNDVMNALVTITNGFRIFHERLFLNQSGAAITITNVGLYLNTNITTGNGRFLYARDNITIVVPLSAGVIIKYREDWTV